MKSEDLVEDVQQPVRARGVDLTKQRPGAFMFQHPSSFCALPQADIIHVFAVIYARSCAPTHLYTRPAQLVEKRRVRMADHTNAQAEPFRFSLP